MTYHQCHECMGEGGWPGFDGEWRDCPDCYGWGHLDDGEPSEDYDESVGRAFRRGLTEHEEATA